MYFYSFNANAYYLVNPVYLKILYQFNILTVSALIAFAINIYYKIAIKSDKKLFAAHQKTMTALEQRDQVLEQLNKELSEAAEYVKRILPPTPNRRSYSHQLAIYTIHIIGGRCFWIS